MTEHRILTTEDEIRAALSNQYRVFAIHECDVFHVATMKVRGAIDGVAYVDAEWSHDQLGIPIGTNGIRFEAFREIPKHVAFGVTARTFRNVWP